MKKYAIVCTEEQLRMIADAVEDWSRFLSGQCEMYNAVGGLRENYLEARKILNEQIKPLVTPELPLGASYGWNGGDCPNKGQKTAIVMSYGIYRQIRHFFACRRKDNDWNCYKSETLTCPEQGGLIEIKELEEQGAEKTSVKASRGKRKKTENIKD